MSQLDPESEDWLRRLRTDRERAAADLRALMLRVAHAEAGRRRQSLPDPVAEDLDDLCQQAANDALLSVLVRLDEYEGRSRFTTWAIKFVLFELSTRLRRHAWRGRPLKLDDEAWSRLPDPAATDPERRTEQHELLGRLKEAIDAKLTERQRAVFVGAALQEVPIDVLAERLGTTRGAIYKTLHDARRRLRAALADDPEVGS